MNEHMSQQTSTKSLVPTGLTRGRLILHQLMVLEEKFHSLTRQDTSRSKTSFLTSNSSLDESTLSTSTSNGGELSDSETLPSLDSVTHRLQVIEEKVDTLTSLFLKLVIDPPCHFSPSEVTSETAEQSKTSTSKSKSTSVLKEKSTTTTTTTTIGNSSSCYKNKNKKIHLPVNVKILNKKFYHLLLKSQISQLLETVNNEHKILTDEIIMWQKNLELILQEEEEKEDEKEKKEEENNIKKKKKKKEESQLLQFKDAQGSRIIINASPGERRQEKEEEELLNGGDLSCKINLIDSSHAKDCIIYLKKHLVKRQEQILALRSLQANVQEATKYRDLDT